MEEETNELDTNLIKWHLANAGLIIVHPFLAHLLKSLDYLDDNNKFINKEFQYRAVFLLHYITTGQNNMVDEVDLAMPKILCGMHIQDPISADVVLTKQEKEIAIELLEVLISRWEKLGKTSVEGLRNTFLNRNGLLEEKDEAFQLTVETSGTDILLDYIPWNINIVKLPWVNNIIYVSWR